MIQPPQPKVSIGKMLVQVLVVVTTLTTLLAIFFGALASWSEFNWSAFLNPVTWKGVWRIWVLGLFGFLLLGPVCSRVFKNDP